MQDQNGSLPATIARGVVGIPAALVPASIKALDRLVAGAVDIPVAWLAQQKAKIDAQTEAYRVVEAGIALAASETAATDPEVVERAVSVLVRKAYRKQINIEAVAGAALLELKTVTERHDGTPDTDPVPEPEQEWLNVFERYAEEASTDRMQKLWGRVLAGEIRQRGSFSMRSLRFLSEFSKSDAEMFATFCQNVFSELAPPSLVKPAADADIRDLLSLQAAGLIDGTQSGLQLSVTFDQGGFALLSEHGLTLLLVGTAGEKISTDTFALTPIGRELMGLLDRDRRECARRVAAAIRVPEIKRAHLAVSSAPNQFLPIELLWGEDNNSEAEKSPTVGG